MSRRSWLVSLILLPILVVLGGLALLGGPGAAPAPVHAAAVCTPVVTRVPSFNQGVYANSLIAVSALAPNDVWAMGHYLDDNMVDQLLMHHWDGTTWSGAPSPTFPHGYQDYYTGFATVARDDIWAVGTSLRPPFTVAVHWNGQRWDEVPMAALQAVGDTGLTSVARVAPNDVWAAGYYSPEANKVNTLLEHWDGTAWQVVPSPNGSAYVNRLYGITALAANDVWAVGDYTPDVSGTNYKTLVLHWDGQTWTIVPSPSPVTFSQLRAITALAPNDIWAVGRQMLHWDGSRWTVTGDSPEVLQAVAAVAANAVWAVGTISDAQGVEHSLVEHWDGHSWSRVAVPGRQLTGVAVVADGVFAVGDDPSGPANTLQTLVLRFSDPCVTVTVTPPTPFPTRTATPTATATATATATPSCIPVLRRSASPNVGSGENMLYAVAAAGPTNLWAVGAYKDPAGHQHALVEHMDGTGWTIVPSTVPSVTESVLTGVTAIAANNIWAVGYAQSGSNPQQTLILHWDGAAWTPIPSPNLGTGANQLQAVAASSATDAWAVGYYEINAFGAAGFLFLHWNGVAWTAVPFTDPNLTGGRLTGVAALAPNDVWAVGLSGNNQGLLALTLHWNGTAWANVPNSAHGYLTGVAAVTSQDVWAVGTNNDTNPVSTLTLHWDGTAWRQVPSPAPGSQGSGLQAVTARSATDAYAVGFFPGPTAYPATLVIHWDGIAWSIVASPNPGNMFNGFYGVVQTSERELWAVGYTSDSTAINYSTTLIARGDLCPPGVPPPGPTVTPTSVPRCAGERFSDVCPGDYFYEPVLYLVAHSAISGYSDGTFRPGNATTRGQLAKIVVLALGWPLDTRDGPHFSDVPVGQPFYAYIETAYHRGVLAGYADGTFRPGANVTRGQVSKILVGAAGWPLTTAGGPHFSDVPPGNPFYGYVETAYSHGILSGYSDGTFLPGANATRGQIAKIVYRTVTNP